MPEGGLGRPEPKTDSGLLETYTNQGLWYPTRLDLSHRKQMSEGACNLWQNSEVSYQAIISDLRYGIPA